MTVLSQSPLSWSRFQCDTKCIRQISGRGPMSNGSLFSRVHCVHVGILLAHSIRLARSPSNSLLFLHFWQHKHFSRRSGGTIAPEHYLHIARLNSLHKQPALAAASRLTGANATATRSPGSILELVSSKTNGVPSCTTSRGLRSKSCPPGLCAALRC